MGAALFTLPTLYIYNTLHTRGLSQQIPEAALLFSLRYLRFFSLLRTISPDLQHTNKLTNVFNLVDMSTVRLPSACIFNAPVHRITNTLVKSPPCLGSVKNISKAFGLKASSGFRASAMAVYKVKLIGPDGEENEFEAPDDSYILDSAENAGIELPYSCRAGSCSTCAGKLALGTVDQSDGCFLDEKQMKDGYLLTCISYPTADCVIHTHKESDLY